MSLGHTVLLHGRNQSKLDAVEKILSEQQAKGNWEKYIADLSIKYKMYRVFADAVATQHSEIDVLINNAGVFRTTSSRTPDGLDVRFVVNTLSPYALTKRLLPLLGKSGRVINLSSAAQAPVDLRAMVGKVSLNDGAAYAQSKLAITTWSRVMGLELKERGPMIVSVNPGSMLGTKMVREAFGVIGGDVLTGANILVKASLSDDFAGAHGRYFDNDAGGFAQPHREALDATKGKELIDAMDKILAGLIKAS